jgi:hypothetical protein
VATKGRVDLSSSKSARRRQGVVRDHHGGSGCRRAGVGSDKLATELNQSLGNAPLLSRPLSKQVLSWQGTGGFFFYKAQVSACLPGPTGSFFTRCCTLQAPGQVFSPLFNSLFCVVTASRVPRGVRLKLLGNLDGVVVRTYVQADPLVGAAPVPLEGHPLGCGGLLELFGQFCHLISMAYSLAVTEDRGAVQVSSFVTFLISATVC